jgi:hypothetical protein
MTFDMADESPLSAVAIECAGQGKLYCARLISVLSV